MIFSRLANPGMHACGTAHDFGGNECVVKQTIQELLADSQQPKHLPKQLIPSRFEMKVVVTGGLGFLGQTLTKALLTTHRDLRSNSSSQQVTSIILADLTQNEYLIDLPRLAQDAGEYFWEVLASYVRYVMIK